MADLSKQAEVFVADSPLRPTPKMIIFSLVILSVGIAIGVVANRYLFLQQFAQTQQSIENDLPIGLKTLKNPAVDQWSGSVTGSLSAKDANSITVTNQKGNTITITVDEGTSFFRQSAIINKPVTDKLDPKQLIISHNDLPVGGQLRGTFFVMPEDGDKNRIVGNSFTYLDASQ